MVSTDILAGVGNLKGILLIPSTDGVLPNLLSLNVDNSRLGTTIVDTCPLTKYEGVLQSLHNAKDDTFNWLETTASTAPAENVIKCLS